ncbi:MAG: ComEC/Rec2 family competence protein [Flavobacteriaceae bacterium]|nr:ComEC/Rec2 family competence protein [Flavobacteriaceae bacterium]
MKLFNFAVIKLTLFLTLGILLSHFIAFNILISLGISFLLITILGFVIRAIKNHLKPPVWFGVLVFITTTSVGMSSLLIHDEIQYPSHYSRYLNGNVQNTTLRIREVLKPGLYQNKYVVDVLKIEDNTVIGKSLLNLSKNLLKNPLSVDEIYFTKTEFKAIAEPLNPYQFDYKAYLKKKHIHHQLFLNQHELLLISSNTHTVLGYAARFRVHIQNLLNHYHFNPDEIGVINALLLGQRQDLSQEIYESYTQAGAVHILAVSGLHVGIILLLLNYLLKPIETIKHGKYFKMVIIVMLLWGFAIIAGLSASVTRAVSMFTIFAIAMQLKRPTNAYNTLAISMFFILLFKPLFIFDVGFQLSYLAVLAIISIQPLLYNIIKPRFMLIDKLWTISTVTIAAQLGIMPLSLFYFHQFPSLFFLSNLVIIPFLGFILGYGILIVVLAIVNALPLGIAEFYGAIISWMNNFITWISNQDTYLFEHISFSIYHVILSYVLIITGYFLIKYRTFKHAVAFLITIIGIQSFLFLKNNYNSNNRFIIYHKSRYSMVGNQHNNSLLIYHQMPDSILSKDNIITNYKVGAQIKTIAYDSINAVYQFNSKILLIIDSTSVYQHLSFEPHFVLLRNSPKVNLTRLIHNLQPELIIIDGSNYNSYQGQWEVTCQTEKIPFHRTSKKGAFIYTY